MGKFSIPFILAFVLSNPESIFSRMKEDKNHGISYSVF